MHLSHGLQCTRVQRAFPNVFGNHDSYQRKNKVKTLKELAEHFTDPSGDTLCMLESLFMTQAAILGPSIASCKGIRNPESTIRLDSLTWGDFKQTVSSHPPVPSPCVIS